MKKREWEKLREEINIKFRELNNSFDYLDNDWLDEATDWIKSKIPQTNVLRVEEAVVRQMRIDFDKAAAHPDHNNAINKDWIMDWFDNYLSKLKQEEGK